MIEVEKINHEIRISEMEINHQEEIEELKTLHSNEKNNFQMNIDKMLSKIAEQNLEKNELKQEIIKMQANKYIKPKMSIWKMYLLISKIWIIIIAVMITLMGYILRFIEGFVPIIIIIIASILVQVMAQVFSSSKKTIQNRLVKKSYQRLRNIILNSNHEDKDKILDYIKENTKYFESIKPEI